MQLVRGDSDHELAATVALLRSKIDRSLLPALLEHTGSAVEIVSMDLEAGLFQPVPMAEHSVIGAVSQEMVAQALENVRAWRGRGLDVRTVLDPTYPQNLRAVFDRPPLLFVEGSWEEEADSRSLAVVGTREASREGLDAAARISEGLVRAGFTIISGMAAGIDTAAHEAALIVGGRTVAVMGTGLDHRYPPENSGLANRIVESGGALLSQFLPHQPPAKWTFGLRNATMSGLALATVVVEATGMSGAKMQARLALQHGRPVFLLTSLVSAESWAREYVQEGRYGATAIPVETAGEIVERMDVLNPPELVLTV